MKSLRITIMMISAILAFSCAPEQKDDMFDVPQDGYTFFEADFRTVDFDAEAEQFWQKGIDVGVFGTAEGVNERYTLKKACDGKAVGEFYGPKVSGDQIVAYYPYSPDFTLFEGKPRYELAPVQKYGEEGNLYEQFCKYSDVIYAFAAGGKLSFSHASGILIVEVRMDGVGTVKSLTLASSEPISGMGGVNEDMSVGFSSSSSKTLCLDCEPGLEPKDGSSFRQFPLVMPAGSYSGVTLTVAFTSGDSVKVKLDDVEVKPLTVSGQDIRTVTVSNGLGGFEVEDGLTFEPLS